MIATAMATPATAGSELAVREDRVVICGWPTDTVAVDRPRDGIDPQTLLLFVPGNPGVVHWYTDLLAVLVGRLGRGHVARGVSYAGHGIHAATVGTEDDSQMCRRGEDPLAHDAVSEEQAPQDIRVSWTMDGQVAHKIEWIDGVLASLRYPPDLVFLSHSIGSHLVQCLLLRRPDLLARTRRVVHLMPFIRFDPPPLRRAFLSSVARSHEVTVPVATALIGAVAATLPRRWLEAYLERALGLTCPKGRRIALDTFLNPRMVKNHLVLGFQEIRELPEQPNDVALRLLAGTPTYILFCGGPDQWAPKYHMEDLRRLQNMSAIPLDVCAKYMESLRHDFVVHPEQIAPVVEFCVESISGNREGGRRVRARL